MTRAGHRVSTRDIATEHGTEGNIMNDAILWVLVGLQLLTVFVTVGMVGKARTPLTPGVAAVSVAIKAVVVGLLVYVITH